MCCIWSYGRLNSLIPLEEDENRVISPVVYINYIMVGRLWVLSGPQGVRSKKSSFWFSSSAGARVCACVRCVAAGAGRAAATLCPARLCAISAIAIAA
jgi:hypothetical protein